MSAGQGSMVKSATKVARVLLSSDLTPDIPDGDRGYLTMALATLLATKARDFQEEDAHS